MVDVHDPETFRREVLDVPEPTVVLFWATWCPFCQRFRPEFDRVGRDLGVRSVAVTLDDYGNPLWEDYDVEVVPTMALFRGGEILDRQDGILGYGLDRHAVRTFLGRVAPLLSGSTSHGR
jgi:thiol-disulfide isomerase/thioredoxin